MKISSHVSACSLKVKESHLITLRIQREKGIVKYGIKFPILYNHVPSGYNEFDLSAIDMLQCGIRISKGLYAALLNFVG